MTLPATLTLYSVSTHTLFLSENGPATVQMLTLTLIRCLNRRQRKIPPQFYWGLAAHHHRTSLNRPWDRLGADGSNNQPLLVPDDIAKKFSAFPQAKKCELRLYLCDALLFCPSVFCVSAHLLVFCAQC